MNILYSQVNKRTLFSKRALNIALCLAVGLLSGSLLIGYSWQIAFFLVLCPIALFIFFVKPEYGLYAFFFILVLMTEYFPESFPLTTTEGVFMFQDIKIAQGVPQLTIAALLVMFLIYTFRIYLIQGENWLIPTKYMFIWLCILLLSTLTGIIGDSDPIEIRVDLMHMLFPVLFFYLCVNILNDQSKIHRMVWILFFACAIKGTILSAYYLAGHGVPIPEVEKMQAVTTYDTADLIVCITMILLAYAFYTKRIVTGWKRFVLVLCTVPMSFTLIFSFRRAAWLGMLASAALFFFLNPSFERKKMLVTLVLIMILFILLLYPSASLIFPRSEITLSSLSARLSSITDPKQSSNEHHYLESLQTLQEILTKNPLLGLGLGSRHKPIKGVDWDAREQPTNIVHDSWLYFWMKTGIMGLIYFLWLGFLYIRNIGAFRRFLEEDNKAIALAIASSAALWFILALVSPLQFYYRRSFLIALFASIVVSLTRNKKVSLENGSN